MKVGTIVVLVLLVSVVFYVIGMYNALVAGRNRFKNAFAQIDVQLQRRYDLIPNLVEAAKAYMGHERDTLEAVMVARNQAHSAARGAAARPEDGAAIGALGAAESLLGGALGRFYAVAEAYPDLKANTTIAELMKELTGSENKLAFAREGFNDAVTDYNNRREQFPTNVIAGMFNFLAGQLLVLDNPAARELPKLLFR